jgi:hypothetical protein
MNDQLTQPVGRLNLLGVSQTGPWYPVARVHFPHDSFALDDQDKQMLGLLAAIYGVLLPTAPKQVEMAFIGMADPSGRPDYNLSLSRRRARAAADFFRQRLTASTERDSLKKVNIVADGTGESGIDSRGTALDAARPMRWRRVDIYANLPPRWVEAGILRLRKRYRKAAEQAITGHRQGIKNLRRQLGIRQRRVPRMRGTALYGYNFAFLAWYEERLKRTERRYQELMEAIDSGTEAFMSWMDNCSRPTSEFFGGIVDRLQKEKKRLQKEAAKNPAPVLDEMIELMDHEISLYQGFIREIKEGGWSNTS